MIVTVIVTVIVIVISDRFPVLAGVLNTSNTSGNASDTGTDHEAAAAAAGDIAQLERLNRSMAGALNSSTSFHLQMSASELTSAHTSAHTSGHTSDAGTAPDSDSASFLQVPARRGQLPSGPSGTSSEVDTDLEAAAMRDVVRLQRLNHSIAGALDTPGPASDTGTGTDHEPSIGRASDAASGSGTDNGTDLEGLNTSISGLDTSGRASDTGTDNEAVMGSMQDISRLHNLNTEMAGALDLSVEQASDTGTDHDGTDHDGTTSALDHVARLQRLNAGMAAGVFSSSELASDDNGSVGSPGSSNTKGGRSDDYGDDDGDDDDDLEEMALNLQSLTSAMEDMLD